jgi:hypothetical protein
MPEIRGKLQLPALWPTWLGPRRVAVGGGVLLFANMALHPTLSRAGLSLAGAAWRDALTPEAIRGMALMVMPAVVLGLVCAARAMHARTALGAVLGSLGAGVVFGVATEAGAYATMIHTTPAARSWGAASLVEAALETTFPGQTLSFALCMLGLALPVARSYRKPAFDAAQEALVVTGAWLLVLGTVASWNGYGATIAWRLELDPTRWSPLCVVPGAMMLVAGLLGDRRLLAWSTQIRHPTSGAAPASWRIDPIQHWDVVVPRLWGARRSEEPDGFVERVSDGFVEPTASVFLDERDRRDLVLARVRAVALAVSLPFVAFGAATAAMFAALAR